MRTVRAKKTTPYRSTAPGTHLRTVISYYRASSVLSLIATPPLFARRATIGVETRVRGCTFWLNTFLTGWALPVYNCRLVLLS